MFDEHLVSPSNLKLCLLPSSTITFYYNISYLLLEHFLKTSAMYFSWLRRIFKRNHQCSVNKWKKKVLKSFRLRKRGKGVDVVEQECDCVGRTIGGTS